MRIIETKAYQFEELDEQTKEKAIVNYRYISVEDDFWYEFIKEDLNSIGIELRSFDIERGSFAEIHLEDFEDTCYLILKFHGENNGTYKIAERYIKEYNSIKDKMDILELDEEYQKEFSEEVLSMLRKEYEDMISDEYIIDMFQANEYEFTAEGKII